MFADEDSVLKMSPPKLVVAMAVLGEFQRVRLRGLVLRTNRASDNYRLFIDVNCFFLLVLLRLHNG